MKTLPVLLLAAVLVSASLPRADAGGSVLYLGGRYHVESPNVADLPFSDGDLSATAGLEYQDQSAYWQLLVDYAWDAGSSTNAIDYVLTPQLNLLFRENGIVAGAGVLKTYTQTADDSTWSDLYYQALAGLQFPLAKRAMLTLLASYPFTDFNDFTDFDTGGLEFTGGLSISF